MARHCKDWLMSFLDYAKHGEAPTKMYFWVGVSAVAGALARRVWIEQTYFRWYPNFYIILVAPPGIVSKSTTAGIAMKLLRQVPGVHFGPDIITWQALVEDLANSTETFELNNKHHIMSALTVSSSELGNFLDPQDRKQIDLLITLWDGESGLEKKTKTSGDDSIENPLLNMIACTTPTWIAGNFPEYMIGGGFTSRAIFVYASKKQNYVAYPFLATPPNMEEHEQKLVHDLTAMTKELKGPFHLTKEAIEWGTAWYTRHYQKDHNLDNAQFGGYIARKQSHIHKLAMIISASQGNSMEITDDQLKLANKMVSELESEMQGVFQQIGKNEKSNHADKIVAFIKQKKVATYEEVYRFVYAYFPALKDFEGVLAGCIKTGMIKMKQIKGEIILTTKEFEPTTNH